jgi:hypothetical protein
MLGFSNFETSDAQWLSRAGVAGGIGIMSAQ